MLPAYYNENDPEKVAALTALMAGGFIAPGEIDNRDIRDVAPNELSRFAQCHFFAGIGLWSVAARAAGIPDDFPFWSGSCPCQPFSAAGNGEGIDDDRHLWPHWFWLIAQQRPLRVVGEQVATIDGLAWLDLVCADMEGSSYAGGSIDLCSAGFGAPNIRQRQYMCWLDNPLGDRRGEGRQVDHAEHERIVANPNGPARGMVNADGSGQPRSREMGRSSDPAQGADRQDDRAVDDGRLDGMAAIGLASADRDGQQPGRLSTGQGRPRKETALESRDGEGDRDRGKGRNPLPAPTNGFWADADWLLCRDIDGPKLRPVEPGSFCLASRHPGRSAELRAYGDAINLVVATEFLKAVKPEMMRI